MATFAILVAARAMAVQSPYALQRVVGKGDPMPGHAGATFSAVSGARLSGDFVTFEGSTDAEGGITGYFVANWRTGQVERLVDETTAAGCRAFQPASRSLRRCTGGMMRVPAGCTSLPSKQRTQLSQGSSQVSSGPGTGWCFRSPSLGMRRQVDYPEGDSSNPHFRRSTARMSISGLGGLARASPTWGTTAGAMASSTG